jgi:protein TonB
MQLSWNRDSDPIRNATAGLLSISDGDQHQDVAMDLPLLQKGSINYTPATSDVVFRLEVSGRGQAKTASEMVRALRTRPSPIPEADAQAAAKAAAASKQPDTPPAGAQPPATQPPQDEAETQTLARPLKPFRAETLSERLHPAPAASTDLPDAPSTGRMVAPGVSVPALNMGTSAPPPPAPAPAPPAAAKSAPPTPSAAQTSVVSGGQIQAAVLVHRKEPDYPRLARETGAKGVVELMATIGVDGKVKKVTVVKGHPMLVKAASDAVLQWLYKPTMLNGLPVEGQTQVLVNFVGDR